MMNCHLLKSLFHLFKTSEIFINKNKEKRFDVSSFSESHLANPMLAPFSCHIVDNIGRHFHTQTVKICVNCCSLSSFLPRYGETAAADIPIAEDSLMSRGVSLL